MDKPTRPVQLSVKIGGDTWRDVSDELRSIADRIDREGPIVTIVSGGYNSGYVAEGVHDPEQTGDKYRMENAEYVEWLKSQNHRSQDETHT